MTAAAPALSRTAPPIAEPAVTPSSAIAAPIAADETGAGRQAPARHQDDPVRRQRQPIQHHAERRADRRGRARTSSSCASRRVRPRRSPRAGIVTRTSWKSADVVHGRQRHAVGEEREVGVVGRRRASAADAQIERPVLAAVETGQPQRDVGAGPRERQARRVVALRRIDAGEQFLRQIAIELDRESPDATRRRAPPMRRRAGRRAARPPRRARWRRSSADHFRVDREVPPRHRVGAEPLLRRSSCVDGCVRRFPRVPC